LRIYFAGSIRGGREDAGIYRELIAALSASGEVLTEHVGTGGEEGRDDAAIYTRDMEWLAQSDVLVAEVSVPSLGVGYEIATAERQGIPVLCLFRPGEGRWLSAMLAGDPAIAVVEYSDVAAARAALRDFVAGRRR
jgi:hypothetical protein